LLRTLATHSRIIAGLFALNITSAVSTVALAYAFATVADGVFLGSKDIRDLSAWLALFLIAATAKAFLLWSSDNLGFQLATAIKTSLRKKIMSYLYLAGPTFVDNEKTGELINIIGEGVDSLDAYYSKYLPQVLTTFVVPATILVVVASIDWIVVFIMIVTVPMIPFFMVLIGRWAEQAQKKQWALLQFLEGHFLDVITGLVTLKIWGRSLEQVHVIRRLSEQLRDSTLGVLKIAFLSTLTLELLATLSTAFVAVAVGLKVLEGTLSFIHALFVLVLAPEFFQPFRLLGGHYHSALSGMAASKQITTLLASSLPVSSASECIAFSKKEFGFSFENVSFTYPNRTQPALRSVSFTIAAGERVALIGPSGSGKSTLFDLMLRFIQPQSGLIRIGDLPLNTLIRADWLSHVSYVPQFPFLFRGTIRNNISFGLDETFGKVESAAAAAGLDEFVRSLPAGYDTFVGDGGVGLSGGEIQRIAIARAFFRNAPLLLLDEPMSAVDPENESLIQESLGLLQKNRTVLMIAHRPSTAAKADRILLLKHGELVAGGIIDDI
jgi:ATP-binding cassette subfamily C protein CydD